MRPIVIAEAGCNHQGNIDKAIDLIKIASSYCSCDIIKFQKRTPKLLLSKEEYDKQYDSIHSYGKTYGEHREFLEFNIKTHKHLQDVCKDNKIDYMCSVWDLQSAKDIISLKPKTMKIPSASNLDFNMLRLITEEFNGQIHLSLGMTTREEEDKILKFFQLKNRIKDLVLYVCTSGYPVDFKDVCLLEIERLKDYKMDFEIGFSGHHLGIAVDVAAFTLGVKYIERHFTLDRTWRGTDQAASLEPEGMRKLVRDLEATSQALSYKNKEVLDVEEVQRRKLKRNINDTK